jgi:hypothetical protein
MVLSKQSITLRTRFSTNCPQLATKCIELVGDRKVVDGHQLSTNVALSDLLWSKPGFKGCLIDGWRPVLADELGGALYFGIVVHISRQFREIWQRVCGMLMMLSIYNINVST